LARGAKVDAESIRVDRWLWRARFYKARNQASDAVSGGLVCINGRRVKSAHLLKPGDRLEITHPQGKYQITVLDIPSRRGPATEAASCYRVDELTPRISRRQRDDRSEVSPGRRPDKKGRRQLRSLKGRFR
jgi:ribosome-associated heat shock protein Hsp15